MTRTISPSYAPLLAALELEGAEVITLAELSALVEQLGIRTAARIVAGRLRKQGWLLPTATAGVWEFAPGAHAGPFGHGDPFVELKAALAAKPSLDSAVCLLSALRAHGFADRAPDRLEVAVAVRSAIPSGLARGARVVVFAARLAHDRVAGVPVHAPATILVHLATRPTDVRGWGEVADALPELVQAISVDDVDSELVDRPRSVRTRLAYLVQGVAPTLAEHLVPAAPSNGAAPKVWFGPRGQLKRHSARFSIADTVLPFDPATLRP